MDPTPPTLQILGEAPHGFGPCPHLCRNAVSVAPPATAHNCRAQASRALAWAHFFQVGWLPGHLLAVAVGEAGRTHRAREVISNPGSLITKAGPLPPFSFSLWTSFRDWLDLLALLSSIFDRPFKHPRRGYVHREGKRSVKRVGARPLKWSSTKGFSSSGALGVRLSPT